MAAVAAIVCVGSVRNEVSYSGLFEFGWACHNAERRSTQRTRAKLITQPCCIKREGFDAGTHTHTRTGVILVHALFNAFQKKNCFLKQVGRYLKIRAAVHEPREGASCCSAAKVDERCKARASETVHTKHIERLHEACSSRSRPTKQSHC